MRSFRDLFVWSAAVELAVRVSGIADELVERRRFALADQLQRAANSVPSNIAEGHGRLTPRDWRHFLSIARGSLYEVEAQLEILAR
ncbi:MAG TPA: four helix bundle protein, partial [Thermoanaerobaculia bacterium]|nr:four helix bundle protein [Thermoanaerobaculia bacterium]